MKYFVIFLIIIGFAGLFPLVNHAYGLWIPESPDTLLEQSQTVFVGNITSVNVLEFEKSSIYSTEENGVEKQIIENYTLSLDQYTVSVEEFLKNPQNSSTMIVLQPTTSIPGRVVPIGGFTVGDRVLFYLEKINKENTYSPESFKIPKQCDAKSALFNPRITLGNGFRIMQDGIQRDDNFTAGIPMQFVYDIDTRTLEGKGYDFVVGIVKRLIDNSVEPVLKEKIHVKSNPCEWIASATWEITPTAGKHIMAIQISEEDGDGGSSSIQFFVKENISIENKLPAQELLDKARNTIEPAKQVIEYKPSPLLQHKQGIPNDEIVCYNNLQPIIKKYNNIPACVKYDSIYKLVNRGWAAREKLETSGPAFEAARVYIENSPTFRFDGLFGVLDTILVSNDTAFPPNFVLKSHFSSKYEGFGDRTHQELTKGPVYHEIILHINGVNITSAIIDGAWDEKGQKMIEEKQIITTNEETTLGIPEKKSDNLSHVENDPKYGSCEVSFMVPGDDYSPQKQAPPFPIEFVGKTVDSFDEAQKITGIRNLVLPTHIPECLKLGLVQVDEDPNRVGINLYYLLEDISLDDLEYVNEVSNKGLIVMYHKDQPAPFFDWKEYAQAQAAAIGKRGKTIEFNNATILLYDRNLSQLSDTGARAIVNDIQVTLSSKIIDITEMENIIKSIFP